MKNPSPVSSTPTTFTLLAGSASQTSGHQVSDPHNCDRIACVGRLLFGVLIAGPDKVLFGREWLPFLVDLKLPFGDMADHGILHRWTHGLRSRLHDDVTHRDGLETGNEGWCLTTVSTHHDTWPRRRILVVRRLRSRWLHHGRRSGCQS